MKMDKIKITKADFEALYEIKDDDITKEEPESKPETVLNEEEQQHDDKLMEEYQ